MRKLRTAIRGAACFGGLTGIAAITTPTVAQEYCVACTGPNALYRCVLEQAKPTGIPLKSLCVRTLTREGRHATCSIKAGTVFDCDAPIKRIDVVSAAEKLRHHAATPAPAPASQPTMAPPSSTGVGSDAPPPVSFQFDGGSTPRPPERNDPDAWDRRKPPADDVRTVEAVDKSASRPRKNSFERAGEAIEHSTRKTWNCLASFFQSC